MLKTGDPAPDFCLQGDQGQICFNELKGKWVVLYFYPKDNTPGCTMEALEFTALNQEFEAEGAKIRALACPEIHSKIE